MVWTRALVKVEQLRMSMVELVMEFHRQLTLSKAKRLIEPARVMACGEVQKMRRC